MPRTMMIAFEGIDCCGKTTHLNLLKNELERRRVSVQTKKFPDYQSTIGQLIRTHLASYWKATIGNIDKPSQYDIQDEIIDPGMLQLLYCVNRLDLMPDYMWENERGRDARRKAYVVPRVLLLDRYCASGCAYGMSDGLDLEWLVSIHRNLPQADLTILVDISCNESKQRLDKRAGPIDNFEARTMDKVREAYMHIFKPGTMASLNPYSGRWKVVDGMGSKEAVFQRILDVVEDTFPTMEEE